MTMENHEDSIDFSGKCVLLIEDDVPSIMYFSQSLQLMNATVLLANKGEEAIALVLGGESIDLVLLDLRLPDIDGYELLKKLKSIRPNLPIVVQSAYTLSANREKAFELGCDDFITKPIHRNVLVKVLIKHLHRCLDI